MWKEVKYTVGESYLGKSLDRRDDCVNYLCPGKEETSQNVIRTPEGKPIDNGKHD